jgi:CubicO group peptidase (beta-lactamase class C family)
MSGADQQRTNACNDRLGREQQLALLPSQADMSRAVFDIPHRGPWSDSAAGGLVSTVDDWHCFARMLLAGGSVGGHRLLSPASVRQMTTDHLTQAQRDASRLFLEGQGWGFGGSVDVAAIDPWNVAGRYGWVGGTGTAAHISASAGAVPILLSQREWPDRPRPL